MIFGHHGLKTPARKVFCFEHGDALVFKLPPDVQDHALCLSGSAVFAPRPDRPAMTNWIVVPAAHDCTWPQFSRTAFDYVATI